MRFFLFCLFLISAGLAGAQETGVRPAALSGAVDARMNLRDHAVVFADESRSLTRQDAMAGAGAFVPVEGALIDFGFGTARYWVRVDLLNDTGAAGTWWVTHDIPVAERVDVWLVPDGGTAEAILTQQAGDGFFDRPIAYRHLVSEVKLGAGVRASLLIAYTTDQATEMPLFIESVPGFFARTQGETAQILALTALILGMGLISTVYLYGLEGLRAFAYCAYKLSSVVLLIHMEGFAFQYLWPEAPGFNAIALAMLSMGSIALGVNFVARFTEAGIHAVWLDRVARATIVAMILLAALSPVAIASIPYKNGTLLAAGFGTILQVVLAVAAIRRRMPGAGTLAFGFGALAASFLFGIFGYLSEGLFAQELVGSAVRLGFLTEAIAFSTAIALRIMAARAERDRSMQEQLRLSEERLHLSEALRRAEDDRQRAAAAAVQSREALASAAHDIRQPLASLQLALSRGETEPAQLKNSLSYLDQIVRAGLEQECAPLGTGDADPPDDGAAERFSAGIVLKNIAAMFGAEAERKGVSLRVVPSSLDVVADPLAVMRSLGNLVSNALQHAGAHRVLVGCRVRDGAVSFEVHDDGRGIPEEARARLLERGAKGDGSEGSGLGLAIVSDLAQRNGMSVTLASRRSGGTLARVDLMGAPAGRVAP